MPKNKSINLQWTVVNEPLPSFIYNEIKEFSNSANTYCPFPEELVQKLAKKHNIPQSYILIIPGIDQGIRTLIRAFGDHTYIFPPTYVGYVNVEKFNKTLHEIPSLKGDQYQVPIREYPQASLIFLNNPNNPCGIVKKSEITELIAKNPQAIVAVDEAYSQYATVRMLRSVKQHPNLVVMRSFSKDYGMAGNRIGYMVAHPKILKELQIHMQWSSISYLSVGAALSALKHETYFRKLREKIVRQRKVFTQFLNLNGFHTLPTYINAVLLRLPNKTVASKLVKHLKNDEIFVNQGNGCSNNGLEDNFIRIAIGTPAQMKVVQESIKIYLKKNKIMI